MRIYEPTNVCDADKLISTWIESNPYHPGEADVRLREYGTSVWAIIGYFGDADDDLDGAARAYEVPLDAIRAAMAYYARHAASIDARIAANAA